jgi:hypothetical protein
MTQVDKIFFQQTFPTGNYANVKMGIEMSLVPGVDNVQEAFVEARTIIATAFKALNPDLTPSLSDYNTGEQAKPKEINLEAGRVEILIENASSMDELQTYWVNADKYNLRNQWHSKMEQLRDEYYKETNV